ncbi:EMB2654 [Symbiodinium sp. CCMP2592]|nr:EMB2654 [Symbiodinium sp. CCMP2592]
MSCQPSWKEAVHYVAEVQRSAVQGSRLGVLHNAAANSAGKKACWRQALQLLDCRELSGAWHEKNLLVAHGIAVDACARAASWASALQGLHSWALQGGEPSLVAFGAAARGLAAKVGTSAWQQAAQLLAMEPPSIFVGNAVLSACSRERLSQQALQLLSAMRQHGPQPDAASYNIVLGLCADEGHAEQAGRLLREARRQDVETNLLMYNLAMKSSLSASQWESAASVLLAMSSDSVPSDEISSSTSIASCARGGPWRFCLALLATLPVGWRGLSGGMVAFSTAGSAAIQALQWAYAHTLLDEVRRAQLQTDTDTFAALSTACMAGTASNPAPGGRLCWPLAASLLKTCKQRHGVVLDTSVGPSVATFSKSSQWRAGIQLLASLRTSGVRPHLICFNSAAMSTWSLVSSMLSGMVLGGLEPDVASWNALLVANPWEKGTETLEAMASLQVELDRVSVSTRLGKMTSAPWRTSLKALASTQRSSSSPNSVDAILAAALLRSSAARRSWQETGFLLRNLA